ncbi:unnamed protein product, partial [Urochloa humidicola]
GAQVRVAGQESQVAAAYRSRPHPFPCPRGARVVAPGTSATATVTESRGKYTAAPSPLHSPSSIPFVWCGFRRSQFVLFLVPDSFCHL